MITEEATGRWCRDRAPHLRFRYGAAIKDARCLGAGLKRGPWSLRCCVTWRCAQRVDLQGHEHGLPHVLQLQR